MSRLQEKVLTGEGINVHIIPSKKYKTITIIAKLKAPMDRETITKRALLPAILRQGTKNYPTRELLQDHLDEMYGASLSLGGGKAGDEHIMSVRMEIANQKYIDTDISIIKDAIEFLREVIFDPHVREKAFDEKVVEREKELLRQQIRSVKDNKVRFAQMRLIDEMCAGETFQVHAQGYEEDLEGITPENLYAYYQSILHTDQFDLYMLGDITHEEVETTILSTFSRPHAEPTNHLEKDTGWKKRDHVQEIVEKENIQQAKLHMGYRTHTSFNDDDFPALLVCNGLFGGFPSSKLFLNVREKHGLAYYVGSGLEGFKGLMYVYSGIAGKDYEKAENIIDEQLKEITTGEFTPEDVEEIKGLLINDLLETMDDAQGQIEMMYQNVVGRKRTASPYELLDQLKEVTKEDVIRVARKIEKDTVYLLTSEEDENA